MAFFSYLIPADGKYPGKTITFQPDGTVHAASAAKSSIVFAEKHEFNDFDQMAETLEKLVERRDGYLVRAICSPDYYGSKLAFQRKLGKMGDGSILWRYDPQWLCLDIDGLPKPDSIDPAKDPEEAIGYLISTLPPYFQNVSCWWQFSSTQSLPGGRDVIKAHLFYYLMTAVPEVKLVKWAESHYHKHHIDPAVMRSNQPIFIAPPDVKGMADWLKARYGRYRGSVDVLDLSLFTARTINRDSKVTPIDQQRILAKYLDSKIGDGEGRAGFNEPIKSAIAALIARSGPDIDREKLKEDVRQFIREAPVNERRSGRSKEEYMADSYLNPLIEALSVKEGESRKQSLNQLEIARDRFVYVTNINRFYDKYSGNYVTKDALNMSTARIGRSLADYFVQEEEFKVVDQITYFPGREEFCAEISVHTGESAYCYNIYRPPRVSDEPSTEAAFFIDHIYKLAGDDAVFHHMMDWMAHNVQKPGEKIMYAMLIQGKQGTGKSALMEALKVCMGESNVNSIETHELLGNFNSWAKGKALAVVEEIRDTTDRFGIYNRLKPVITAPTITLNEKNVAQVTMRNRMNVMAFTNYENAVPMDDDDRRFFVHFSPMEPEPVEYYEKLFNLIQKHPGAIRRAFLEWNISHFVPTKRAPMTTAKQFLQDHAGPPLTRLLRRSNENMDWPLKFELTTVEDLHEALRQKFKVTDINIALTLRGLGAREMKRRVIVGGKPRYVWCVRNHAKWEKATDDEIAAYYKPAQIDPFSKEEGYVGGENTNKTLNF